MSNGNGTPNGNGVNKTAVALAELSGTIKEYMRQHDRECARRESHFNHAFDLLEERVTKVEDRSKENERKIDMKLSTRGIMTASLTFLVAVSILLIRFGPSIKELAAALEAAD